MLTKMVQRIHVFAGLSLIFVPRTASAMTAHDDSGAATVAFLAILVILLLIYMLPSFVAFARAHPNRWLILAVNISIGATGLGWLGCLIWACNAVHRSVHGSHGGESGLNLFVNDAPRTTTVPALNLPIEQLGRLKALYDDGALDTGEYEVLRRRILRQWCSVR